MKLLQVALLALERTLQATEIKVRVQVAPDGESVTLFRGVRLFSRKGKLCFVPEDGR